MDRPTGRSRVWRLWRPLWRWRSAAGGRVFALAVATIGFGGIAGVAYFLAVRLNEWRGTTVWDPVTALDREIPALPWTIAIYVTNFLYFPIAAHLAPRSDRGRVELMLLTQAGVVIGAISVAFFLAFPCEIYIREEMVSALAGSPALVRGAFDGLYLVDAAYNAWPSMHVSETLICVFAFHRWRRPGAVASALIWTAWVALALSILTTRQHFAFDLVTGTALGWLAWAALIRPGVDAWASLDDAAFDVELDRWVAPTDTR